MIRTTTVHHCRLHRALFIVLGMGAALVARAQDWSPSAAVDAGLFTAHARVAIASENDLLVLAVAHAGGGNVQLRGRHQGGFDQWGVMASIQDATPWYGSSVALRPGLLAVGSPGDAAGGAFTGAVHLYAIDTAPGEEQLDLIQSLQMPDASANERGGYSVRWIGDTLVTGFVSRSSFRSIGGLTCFVPEDGTYVTSEPLAIGQISYPVPFIRWFGASIAASGARLAVAAPFSGFESTNAQQNLGSIHMYYRDSGSPSGWSPDTAWSDLTLDGLASCAFERMELGRWGMAFVNGGLIIDQSVRYDGGSGDALDPWMTPMDSSGACSACGLRIVRQNGSIWDFDGAQAPAGSGPPLRRAPAAWCAEGDSLIISTFDPVEDTWRSTLHRRDEGGSDAWGAASVLATGEACDTPSGPILLAPARLIRVNARSGTPCSVPQGMMRLTLEVFDR